MDGSCLGFVGVEFGGLKSRSGDVAVVATLVELVVEETCPDCVGKSRLNYQ